MFQGNANQFFLLMLFGFFLVLLIFDKGRYEFILPLIYVVYVCLFVGVQLLTWQQRKKQAGELILKIGFLSISTFNLCLSILSIVCAGFYTWSVINHQISAVHTPSTPELNSVFQAIFYWAMAIYLLFAGLSSLELRENGICYHFLFLKWDQLTYCKWIQEGSNVLIIRFKKPGFFVIENSWRLQVPFQKRDAVEQILAEHLISDHS